MILISKFPLNKKMIQMKQFSQKNKKNKDTNKMTIINKTANCLDYFLDYFLDSSPSVGYLFDCSALSLATLNCSLLGILE